VHLRALRFEQPVDRDQLRSRVLAFAGLWFLLAGMLAAAGFAILLLVSLLGVVVAAGIWLARRHHIGERLRGIGLQQRVRRSAGSASRRARTVLEARQSESPVARARRLNELGAQLRREGDYERAAEQHLAALAIVRELGDRHAEALTLNNLALALVHTGSVSLAVERFEQALVLLRELGDKEHEGQVIANLGFVRRRQGRDEDAEFLLTAALDKLPPESSAYRHVEEQLRHAS
jgi:tetratricopeptide (TPR) repeat protein